ncbi:MAG: TetR/AcrR family transcriptional regulator [Planctomycetes bacterium]|nr:TetR/AcrR family transcriptional regulator [Planctomycetota bacterium]
MSPASDTRENLIAAAMELFTLQGYANTGLAQIARKAGVLPGSLYYFFPTKEDLLHATLERRKELLQSEVLDPIWSRIDDPIERVFGLLKGYRQMLEMTEFCHGCPIGNLVIEVGETHPNARRLLVQNFENWLDAIERCFAAAANRLPQETDARQLAVFVLVTMEGAVMLARAYRNFEAYDAAVVQLRDHVERLLAEGTDRARDVPHRSNPTRKSDEARRRRNA